MFDVNGYSYKTLIVWLKSPNFVLCGLFGLAFFIESVYGIPVKNKNGVEIEIVDVRFLAADRIQFKKSDRIRTFEISTTDLDDESLARLKASSRREIVFKLSVESLGTKRKSEKTWTTNYGSGSKTVNVSRRFQAKISTHSYLPSKVVLKVYSIQGKDSKAAYLLKEEERLFSRSDPIIALFSDDATLDKTKYVALGYDTASGNDDIDFYLVAFHPDSEAKQEWCSSPHIKQLIEKGELPLLDESKAKRVANEYEKTLR